MSKKSPNNGSRQGYCRIFNLLVFMNNVPAMRVVCFTALMTCSIFAHRVEAGARSSIAPNVGMRPIPRAALLSSSERPDLRPFDTTAKAIPKAVSVDDFGAHSNDSVDDTIAIQAAIHYCYEHGVHILSFTEGGTYLMSSSRSQNSIVLYGSHIVVEGNGATILSRTSVAGYFGAVIDIGGLINGKTYPGIGKYAGKTQLARDITVKNLTIRHEAYHMYLNSIGIHNVDGVLIQDVKILNPPQTGIAIVSDSKDHPVANVVLERCDVEGSGRHAFRISLQGSADTLTVRMDHCQSGGVRGPEIDKEIRGEHVQVWYRAAGHGGNVGLTITDSKFDSSGVILANRGSRNFVLEDNDIEGGVVLRGGHRNDAGFLMRANRIGTGGFKDFRVPFTH